MEFTHKRTHVHTGWCILCKCTNTNHLFIPFTNCCCNGHESECLCERICLTVCVRVWARRVVTIWVDLLCCQFYIRIIWQTSWRAWLMAVVSAHVRRETDTRHISSPARGNLNTRLRCSYCGRLTPETNIIKPIRRMSVEFYIISSKKTSIIDSVT